MTLICVILTLHSSNSKHSLWLMIHQVGSLHVHIRYCLFSFSLAWRIKEKLLPRGRHFKVGAVGVGAMAHDARTYMLPLDVWIGCA